MIDVSMSCSVQLERLFAALEAESSTLVLCGPMWLTVGCEAAYAGFIYFFPSVTPCQQRHPSNMTSPLYFFAVVCFLPFTYFYIFLYVSHLLSIFFYGRGWRSAEAGTVSRGVWYFQHFQHVELLFLP